tara:strand:- start:2519 stop:2803 length:285 start_codon:yes stop_codon:yes gene_type:complete
MNAGTKMMVRGISGLNISSKVKEIEIQYKPLKKYPKPKNHPIRKKYLLVKLNFLQIFKMYSKRGKVKKLIGVKLYGEKLKDVRKPKIKGIRKNI